MFCGDGCGFRHFVPETFHYYPLDDLGQVRRSLMGRLFAGNLGYSGILSRLRYHYHLRHLPGAIFRTFTEVVRVNGVSQGSGICSYQLIIPSWKFLVHLSNYPQILSEEFRLLLRCIGNAVRSMQRKAEDSAREDPCWILREPSPFAKRKHHSWPESPACYSIPTLCRWTLHTLVVNWLTRVRSLGDIVYCALFLDHSPRSGGKHCFRRRARQMTALSTHEMAFVNISATISNSSIFNTSLAISMLENSFAALFPHRWWMWHLCLGRRPVGLSWKCTTSLLRRKSNSAFPNAFVTCNP